MELNKERVKAIGKRNADLKFTIDVLLLFRKGIIKPTEEFINLNTYSMYKSYFKIGWRSLVKNKGYSCINIVGLTAGMAVTLLIGMWVFDEVSFNRYHKNYDHIAQVFQHQKVSNEIKTDIAVPVPLAAELKSNFRSDFKHVVQMWWEGNHLLNGFQYRTELTWWIFTSAGFWAIVITLLTVSYQSIKAAIANPVNSLRSE